MKLYEKMPPPAATVPIKVAHIDDDPVFAQCVKDTLTQHHTIGEVSSYEHATEFLTRDITHYDVVIVDHVLKDMTGLELIRQMSQRYGELPIISFSNNEESSYAQKLKQAGVEFYLPKSRLASLANMVVECYAQTQSTFKQKIKLKPDEESLLLMCCNDLSRAQMAEKLFLGQDAVKMRKQQLAKRLDVQNSNISFLKWAIRNGYFRV